MSDLRPSGPPLDKDELLDRIQSAANRMSDKIRREQLAARSRSVAVAQQATKRSLGSPEVAAAACLIFVVTTVATLSGNGLFRFEPPPMPESQYRQFLNFRVEQIQRHYVKHGVLPPDLSTIDPEIEDGWRYERLGTDGFRLTLVEDDFELVHTEAALHLASAGAENDHAPR